MVDFHTMLLEHRRKNTMATNPPINIEDDPTLNVPNSNTTEPNEYTTESQPSRSLDDIGFNDEQDEYERRRLINPTGDWLKSEDWSFDPAKNIRVNTDDSVEGDIDPAGRTSYTVYGYPEERLDKEGNEYRPFMRFTISPDRRYDKKPDRKGQVDFLYKMFLAAKDVFIAVHERKPKNMTELMNCLMYDHYVVNTMNGDDGPFVTKLKPPRQQRS